MMTCSLTLCYYFIDIGTKSYLCMRCITEQRLISMLLNCFILKEDDVFHSSHLSLARSLPSSLTLLPSFFSSLFSPLSPFPLPLSSPTSSSSLDLSPQGRPQDLGGGGAKKFYFQIWEFACREATCCAWRSHAHC